jgi:glycosyltransferase involved in cell wall biosynthesis
MLTFSKLDRRFSWEARRRAQRTRSHLFLYSPYAWEAFTASYSHTPRKILFQYHPHQEFERRLLAKDSALHPSVGESFFSSASGKMPEELARRERDAWKHSDLIFCASAFTQRSLLEAGADERRCRVVSYGIDVPRVMEGNPPRDSFDAVFVGSGGQRKGLHQLLFAWQRAILPPSSRLTLVCRVMDRHLERLARSTPRVEIMRSVPQRQLNRLYSRSSLFVMPSLVEGFGQVYLEALAQGCPVLGTVNTCLPDLGGEADGIFLVAPGNIDELVCKLEQLSRRLPSDCDLRVSARACAARFTWPAFRQGIRRALNN